MALTVRDVLALPALTAGDPVVAAGSAGLDREVRWVHVAEVPDVAPLLRGGELILTTGVAWPSAAARLRQQVRALADVGVSGIVLELGRRYDAVPAAVLEVAEECGLAVIALRTEIRFVAVTEAVHQLILAAREQLLAFANGAHAAFTQLSVSGAPRSEILSTLADLAQTAVVLESLGHHPIASAGSSRSTSSSSGADDELLDNWQDRSRQADPGWLSTEVGSLGQHWGRLVLPSPDPERVEQQRMLLERAGEALTILQLAERDRFNAVQQANRSLLDELLAGRLSEVEARARAADLGFAVQSRVFAGARVVSASPQSATPIERQLRAAQLATIVNDACRASRLPALVTAGDSDHATALLALPQRAATERELQRFAQAVVQELESIGWSDPHRITVGRSVPGLVDARVTLEESQRVAEVLAATAAPPSRGYVRIDDLGLAGLLSTVSEEPRWVAFAEAQLAPLLREDAARRSDLEATLLSYVEVGGNKSELARTRNLSRPAIYTRLERIEKLLAVDLTDASTISALHVALIVRRLHTGSHSR